jgi:hypothetical protein
MLVGIWETPRTFPPQYLHQSLNFHLWERLMQLLKNGYGALQTQITQLLHKFNLYYTTPAHPALSLLLVKAPPPGGCLS